MKKFQFLLLILFFFSTISAQNTDEKKYLLTTNTNFFGLSYTNFLDPYLSPVYYKGIGMNFNHESRCFLRPENTNISSQSTLNLEASYNLNPENTSYMMFMGADYSWGMHYHFRPAKGIHLLAGGLLDGEFGFKDIERNVNNPINLDLAANLNLSGVAMYDIRLHRRTLRLQLELQTPVIGYMFVPQGGESYYEMFDLGNMSNTFHVSSFINKRGLKGTFTVDVPFNRSIWRFGLNFTDLKYSANNLVFVRNEIGFVIGTTFDAFSFAGRKNKMPGNFISTNN